MPRSSSEIHIIIIYTSVKDLSSEEIELISDFRSLLPSERAMLKGYIKDISDNRIRKKGGNVYNISSTTINRLRHNQCVTTQLIDNLCVILNCNVEDIIKFEKQN